MFSELSPYRFYYQNNNKPLFFVFCIFKSTFVQTRIEVKTTYQRDRGQRSHFFQRTRHQQPEQRSNQKPALLGSDHLGQTVVQVQLLKQDEVHFGNWYVNS